MTVFFDTETHCFAPGNQAPRVVCMQWWHDMPALNGVARLVKANGERYSRSNGAFKEPGKRIDQRVREWLESGETLVGHNAAYDLACLVSDYPDLTPLVWQAYREDRIHDTMLRQKLADIGRGRYRTRRYDLGSVAAIHGFRGINKDDPWRTRYAELENVPLADWPSEAIRYALLDAEATRAAYLGQEARYAPELLTDACSQGRKFWALQLASVWGIRTSARGVASLREGVEKRIEQLRGLLTEPIGCTCPDLKVTPNDVGKECAWCGHPILGGLLRPNGTRDTKTAKHYMMRVCEALGVPVAMTDGNDVSLSSDACDATEDELLKAYTEYSSMAKTLSTDVPMLERGLVMPLHSHFDLVESGRTSSAKPNIQNIKRNGLAIRECFVPRGFDSRSYELDGGAKKG